MERPKGARTTGSGVRKECAPVGGRKEWDRFAPCLHGQPVRHPLPGCSCFFAMIRWFSLALLASPPANFPDASGVAKCMTRSSPRFLVRRSSFLIRSLLLALGCSFVIRATAASEGPRTKNKESGKEVFRPEAGKIALLEKAHCCRGELVFVGHATRRGSLRVQGTGTFRRNDPHPFAMLPYGMVRYHG